jgi:DNA-binding HxlR family transcriptional regulator
MTGRRTYGDACGVARALDLVGERWALLVVRELLFGPKRFTDLRAGLPRVSPDVLSQRLRELEDSGLVRRGRLPPPAGSAVYELTPRGQELEPVILALGRFGSLAPFPPGPPRIGSDSLALALETLFDPERADDLDATVELRLGNDRFVVRVAGQGLEIRRGSAQASDATIAGNPMTLAAVLWQDGALGDLAIEGDRALVRRFARLFPLPAGG